MDDHMTCIQLFNESIARAYEKHRRKPPEDYNNIITMELYQDFKCLQGFDPAVEMRIFLEYELKVRAIPYVAGMSVNAFVRKLEHMPYDVKWAYHDKIYDQAKSIMAPIFAEFEWHHLFPKVKYVCPDVPVYEGEGIL